MELIALLSGKRLRGEQFHLSGFKLITVNQGLLAGGHVSVPSTVTALIAAASPNVAAVSII